MLRTPFKNVAHDIGSTIGVLILIYVSDVRHRRLITPERSDVRRFDHELMDTLAVSKFPAVALFSLSTTKYFRDLSSYRRRKFSICCR